MKTNKFLLGALLCVFVMGFTVCNANESGITAGGACSYAFPVSSSGKKVYFSKGNLQYQASTDTWRFAENQYDHIGGDNANISSSYSGWIDLFGWGTGNNPTLASSDYKDYATFTDWGVNAISNDGNKANQWRTLTYEEWNYLLNTRANASSLQGVACINLNADGSEYANGLILLSDSWIAPAGVTFKSGFASGWGVQAYADYQIFTLDQWSKLEKAGAVFLPVSGGRDGTDVSSVGNYGDYWSATLTDEGDACYLSFVSSEAGMGDYYRFYGKVVRLVRDVK
ncbi:MAG: hypothetical protein MSS82_06200 [Bacteroidales bacterium]|nr:hypothetical protein [Bacteroidales bacterium]